MEEFLNDLPKLAKDKHKENKTFFTKLKKESTKATGLYYARIA